MPVGTAIREIRSRISVLRDRLERLLLWRIWERMLEIEFVDRSVALAAGKAFVSFFPLVIVVAAFVPERTRASIVTTLTSRLGMKGDAYSAVQTAFASPDEVRKATGVLGLVLTIFFATSFTTALQRVYFRAWRRPTRTRTGAYWRGLSWLLAVLLYMALLGAVRNALGGPIGIGLFAILSLALSSGIWVFSAWFFLMGDVRVRVLVPTGVITGVALTAFAVSATIWMPSVVTSNEAQFGFFGVALALVTWFSGAAICILIGACAGPVLAEDVGWVGNLVRGGADSPLTTGAPPSLAPPTRELSLRDAFHGTEGP